MTYCLPSGISGWGELQVCLGRIQVTFQTLSAKYHLPLELNVLGNILQEFLLLDEKETDTEVESGQSFVSVGSVQMDNYTARSAKLLAFS